MIKNLFSLGLQSLRYIISLDVRVIHYGHMFETINDVSRVHGTCTSQGYIRRGSMSRKRKSEVLKVPQETGMRHGAK